MSETPSGPRSPEELFEAASALFEELCDLPAADRTARLAAVDAELCATVEELLEIDSRTGSGLDHPPLGDLSRQPAELPETVAGFRVLELLGAGGAGVVYKARQAHPDRLVAVKVVRSAAVSDEQLRRFEHEAQVLAWLEHPGIARIFAAGTTETGHAREPYFAMELVEGLPLTRHADERGLGTRARLELLAKVCDAVHHAHQKGVIHRDLKPSNVLVTAGGEPKVLDFGVARVTSSDLGLTTLHTHTGELLGTLPYMSPEQLAADPSALDIRSDVYSLGVLAYQLLSGSLPHDLAGTRLAEAARRIAEDEPSTLGQLDRSLRGDVETIVGKAIAKEKERRYASAEELAVDIRRHLADEPIAARPPTTLYQLERFARRNRVLVGGVAAVFVALAVGTASSTYLYFEKEEERKAAVDARTGAELAEEEERTAREAAEAAEKRERAARREAEDEADLRVAMFDQLASMLSSPTPWRQGSDVRMIDVLDAASAEAEASFRDRPLLRAQFFFTFATTYAQLGFNDRALPFAEESYHLTLEHDPNSLRLSMAQQHYGRILFDTGDTAGLEHMQESLALEEALDGPADARAIFSEQLGVRLLSAGRIEEAEQAILHAIEVCESSQGTTRLEAAICYKALGDLQVTTGRYGEAEVSLGTAIELFREAAPDTKYLSQALLSLANLYQGQGRLDLARANLEESIRIDRGLGATELPDFAASLGNSATLHALGGEFGTAIERYEEALALTRRLHEGVGPNPDEAILLANLANTYRNLGRLEEALESSLEASEHYASAYGEHSVERQFMLAITARTLIDLGRAAEGLARLQEVFSTLAGLLPPNHPNFPELHVWAGRAHLALGDPDAALASFGRARELQRSSPRPDPVTEVLADAGTAAGLLLVEAVDDALAGAEAARDHARATLPPGFWARDIAAGILGLCRAVAAESGSAEEHAGWSEHASAVEALRSSPDPLSHVADAERLTHLGEQVRELYGS